MQIYWHSLRIERFIFTSVLKVNVSSHLFRQNVRHRCRGGWMFSDVTWRKTSGRRQPEGASPHNTTSSDEAANTGVSPHIFHPAIYWFFWSEGVSREPCNAIISNLLGWCWELNTLTGERNRNICGWHAAETQWLSVTHSHPWGVVSFMNNLSLLVSGKKDAGMRSIQNGKVPGRCFERPVNELINASSLIRGCQPPLALLFNACYCFHGNWYSHPRPHINIQLHLIWQLSGGC